MGDKSEILAIIEHNGGSSRFSKAMLSLYQEWNDFPYTFWIEAIELIKNNPLDLYSYIPFTYRMLGIDLLPQFYLFDDINESTRTYIDDAISDNHGLTHIFRSDLSTIEKFGGEMFLNLIGISNKLEKEGAIKVEKLKYYLDGKIYLLKRQELFHECSKSSYEVALKKIVEGLYPAGDQSIR